MEKKFIAIGLISIMIFVVFCGCENDPVTHVKSNFIVEDREIRTVRFVGWNEREILVNESGTFHYHPDMEAYEIIGYLKNQKNEEYYRVVITADYFDENDNLLSKQIQDIYDMVAYGREPFMFKFTNSSYFEIVDYVKFSYDIIDS